MGPLRIPLQGWYVLVPRVPCSRWALGGQAGWACAPFGVRSRAWLPVLSELALGPGTWEMARGF